MIFGKRRGSEAEDRHLADRRDPGLGPSGGRTVVGRRSVVRGIIKGEGPVLVRGAVEGEIILRGRLSISPMGKVDAEVQAETVEISGEAQGTMRASGRVVLASSAIFEGDMAAALLEVRPGSVLQGKTRVAGVVAGGKRGHSH
jgi:cytoskeletal protein CcmA (bactofilin family)